MKKEYRFEHPYPYSSAYMATDYMHMLKGSNSIKFNMDKFTEEAKYFGGEYKFSNQRAYKKLKSMYSLPDNGNFHIGITNRESNHPDDKGIYVHNNGEGCGSYKIVSNKKNGYKIGLTIPMVFSGRNKKKESIQNVADFECLVCGKEDDSLYGLSGNIYDMDGRLEYLCEKHSEECIVNKKHIDDKDAVRFIQYIASKKKQR